MTTAVELDAPEPLTLTRTHTVVLVDDEPAVLGSLRRVLRAEPYELRATTSPEVALAWVEWDGASLVVLDHRMPGIMGTELAERVRRLSPRTVRVMLTGYPGNALVRQGLAEDVHWLISKPWNDDALRLTIRRLLRDSESGPPPVPKRRAQPDVGGRSWPELFRRVFVPVSSVLARATGAGLGFLLGASEAGGTWRF